ncbi:hypothetical protein [Botrimarina mediterranea]|uniref:Uncharacterized protein n=1 Tax=Botrimarina mediterranea TaxID=2528022 RepID=A0A518KC74_9BACT|nr:hypothetical protein [Botrimarina mediterranea]QDV75403.1 hypothetical protein Spa11_36200 [Botrimarina mediterranea]
MPYLFGDVDRRGWLENFVIDVEAAAGDSCRLCLWFDGHRFRIVEPARTVQIATESAKRLRP